MRYYNIDYNISFVIHTIVNPYFILIINSYLNFNKTVYIFGY